ncbi:MAG: hypothetical protein ABI855_07115 [Bacteroidota bacterium]
MEHSFISYHDIKESQGESSSRLPIAGRFKHVADLRNTDEGFVTFTFTKDDIDRFYEQVQFRNEINFIRDNYCIVAIKNLIKKNEFLQLSIQFSEELITEDEYETELHNNPNKYLIQMNYLEHPGHVNIISGILNKIGRAFNTDEVSELFSIDIQSLNKQIKAAEKK